MGRSQALRAVIIGLYCTAFVLGDVRGGIQRKELGKDRKLLQVDIANVASGLIVSGLQQSIVQPLESQLVSGVNRFLEYSPEDTGRVVSEATRLLTNAGQQTMNGAASALNSLVSGVVNPGRQTEQLLSNALQMVGQEPDISALEASASELLSSALNPPQLFESLVTGQGQREMLPSLAEAFELPPAAAPLVDLSQALQDALQLPGEETPLPSFTDALQNAFELPEEGAPPPSFAENIQSAFQLPEEDAELSSFTDALQNAFELPEEGAPPPSFAEVLENALEQAAVGAPFVSFTDVLQNALRQAEVGTPLPDTTEALQDALQEPEVGAPAPSFTEQVAFALPPAGALESGIPQLPTTAFPLPAQTVPVTVQGKPKPTADIPGGLASSALLLNTAEAGIAAPSLADNIFGPALGPMLAPTPAPKMALAPAPWAPAFTPMFAPAPAPEQDPNTTVASTATTLVQRARVFAAAFAQSFGLPATGGASGFPAIPGSQPLLQQLQVLSSPLTKAGDYLKALKSEVGTLEYSCTKDKVELPKKKLPSCAGKSMQLSLVPWNCVLDDDSALLSCSPAYLTLTERSDSCSLLDFSVGGVEGKKCGLLKSFGSPKTKTFGGEKFSVKALDALITLKNAAGGNVDGPLAMVAIASAPVEDITASLTAFVKSFLGG